MRHFVGFLSKLAQVTSSTGPDGQAPDKTYDVATSLDQSYPAPTRQQQQQRAPQQRHESRGVKAQQPNTASGPDVFFAYDVNQHGPVRPGATRPVRQSAPTTQAVNNPLHNNPFMTAATSKPKQPAQAPVTRAPQVPKSRQQHSQAAMRQATIKYVSKCERDMCVALTRNVGKNFGTCRPSEPVRSSAL